MVSLDVHRAFADLSSVCVYSQIGAKLVLIGSTIETGELLSIYNYAFRIVANLDYAIIARRVGQSAWSSFLSSFYLTAHFSEVSSDFIQHHQPNYASSSPQMTHFNLSLI